MSPYRASALAVAAAVAATLAFVLAPGARADKSFDLSSLDGTYHFAIVEIQMPDDPEPVTVYCNGYGRIAFDGAGAAEILDGTTYGTCSDGSPTTVSSQFTYEVDPEGSVLLYEASDPTTTSHCQIADKGNLLICDGTGGAAGLPAPEERALWMVTAVKL